MATRVGSRYSAGLHPLHAIFLAGTIPLFLGALLSDIAYAQTYQIQWSNFASWLIAGGLLFGAITLVFAVVGIFRADQQKGRYAIYLLILLAAWLVGFVNVLVHAKDAWASMPMGLILSAIVTVLVCAATWIGFGHWRQGGRA